MDLDQFKQGNKPAGKSHRLFLFVEEIEQLLASNYSHAQIIEYLHLNNLKCSPDSLSYFIRKHLKSSPKPAALDQQSKSLAIKPSIDSPPPQKSVNNQEQIADKAFSQINLEEFL